MQKLKILKKEEKVEEDAETVEEEIRR